MVTQQLATSTNNIYGEYSENLLFSEAYTRIAIHLLWIPMVIFLTFVKLTFMMNEPMWRYIVLAPVALFLIASFAEYLHTFIQSLHEYAFQRQAFRLVFVFALACMYTLLIVFTFLVTYKLDGKASMHWGLVFTPFFLFGFVLAMTLGALFIYGIVFTDFSYTPILVFIASPGVGFVLLGLNLPVFTWFLLLVLKWSGTLTASYMMCSMYVGSLTNDLNI